MKTGVLLKDTSYLCPKSVISGVMKYENLVRCSGDKKSYF
jgi:hypothetical protein